jgi:hypothetical protein
MIEPKIDLLSKALAGAELNYRDAYQRFGGSDIRSGRAWDKMRKAGDAIREHFYQQEECTPGISPEAPLSQETK